MPALVEKLFGNGHLPEEVQGELRTILLQMRNERNAFERIASEAQSSVDEASKPMDAMAERIASLEQQLHALEQLAAKAAGLEAQQRDVSSRIDRAAQQAEGLEAALDPIRADLGQTKHLLQNSTSLRADLEPLLDLGGQLKAIRADVGALRAELADVRQSMAAARQQHDIVERRSASAAERLGSLEGMYGEMTVGLQVAEQRMAQLHSAVESASTLVDQVPDLRRELHTLRALRDYVAQKVSELEQQRETVDYATSQGTRLTELVQRIDRDLEAQQEKARSLIRLEEEAARLGATQNELSRQLDRLADRQRDDARADEARRQEFHALQELMDGRIRETISRFEFERERLDAASTQIADLRQAIAEAERRFDGMRASQEALAILRHEIGQLSGRVASTTENLTALDSYAGRMATVKSEIVRAEQAVTTVARQATDLRSAIASAEGQILELRDLSERTEQQTRDLTGLREYLGQIEQRACKWEAAESLLAQATDDAARRQATVEALRNDLQRMLDVANETTDAARAIAGFHEEISDSRRLVDDVITEIRSVKDESARLEDRRRALTGVEQEIARAEAVMIDIRTSLDTLHEQKAFLEQVMETAGSLRFQSKQAEALIATMRDAGQRLAPVSS